MPADQSILYVRYRETSLGYIQSNSQPVYIFMDNRFDEKSTAKFDSSANRMGEKLAVVLLRLRKHSYSRHSITVYKHARYRSLTTQNRPRCYHLRDTSFSCTAQNHFASKPGTSVNHQPTFRKRTLCDLRALFGTAVPVFILSTATCILSFASALLEMENRSP